MRKTQIVVAKLGYRCLHCSHEWVPTDEYQPPNYPNNCPSCKSPNWRRPKLYSWKKRKSA